MTEPTDWEHELRQTLRAHADDLTSVTPWQPPAGAGSGRGRPRWLAPLAAAAVVFAAAGLVTALARGSEDHKPAAFPVTHSVGHVRPTLSPSPPRSVASSSSASATSSLATSGATTPRSTPSTRTSPSHSQPASTSAATQVVSGCRSSDLKLQAGSKQGAAGTGYATYLLRNTGSVRCTLFGFPGVSLLNDQGHLVGHPATRTTATPRLVTVPPGAAASYVVTSNAVSCPGAVSRYESQRLRVYPPNNTVALTLGGNYIACELRVGPVHLG